MTIDIKSCSKNSETQNAERFRQALLASEPALDHPDIKAVILCALPLQRAQLDLVMLYYDPRPVDLQLKTPDGTPIHSFVLLVEVKHHSSDRVRFEGVKVHVRYGDKWSDVTDQCDRQTFALKDFQTSAFEGAKCRNGTFVQRAIWLPSVQPNSLNSPLPKGSVAVHLADLGWANLVGSFVKNRGQIRTLNDDPGDRYFDFQTLRDHLAHEVIPTRLDLRRMNALTQSRFDEEKTAYIRNLGNGLLILRGRGGTGKTFALLQIAIYLASQNKKAAFLTYNHGLIADINRALHFLEERGDIDVELIDVMTRYSFIQHLFIRRFGLRAERIAINHIEDISEREKIRLNALNNSDEFLNSKIPGQCSYHKENKCCLYNYEDELCAESIWKEVCPEISEKYQEYDFVLVDEGQDWSESQRDLLYKIAGSEKVVVADGVDQFVGVDRCEWDTGKIAINRRHGLRASRRTKAATCQTVAAIAQEFGLSDWDLQPDPDAHGGRFSILVEPDPRRAMERAMEILDRDLREDQGLRAVDNLICLPSKAMTPRANFPNLFDSIIQAGKRDSWRGFCDEGRRHYPWRNGQLRAILYNSCRGMEGWTTLCMALDQFYDFQIQHPRIDEAQVRADLGLFVTDQALDAEVEARARLFALNWLMIPLTRSIDHLLIHLSDEDSALGSALKTISARTPGAIDWIA